VGIAGNISLIKTAIGFPSGSQRASLFADSNLECGGPCISLGFQKELIWQGW
jgi:hypothetical protein